jgi:hypothetical protein
MAMAESKPRRPRAPRKPVKEIECAEARFVAHHALNAVELTVVDQTGRGYRTWIGADLAPHAALKFCGAVMRLTGADST